MTQQPTMENKKAFFKNDRKLVCSMLIFYGLCILGLIVATFWGLDRRQRTISANATWTAFALATQQANVTATAVARLTEQDQYEYIERFDRYSGYWFVGLYEKQYGDARISIKDGVYIWDIADPKDSALSTEFYKKDKIKDFDVYMDTKFVESSAIGSTCSGFFFRRQSTWDDGTYIFTICNDSHFEVQYYEANKWRPINFSEYESTIQPSDWNRMEISARGNFLVFTVNNTQVFEMTDDRLKDGNLGIFIDIDKGNSAVIWFDNFGFQSR
jgi:hypothetical protein